MCREMAARFTSNICTLTLTDNPVGVGGAKALATLLRPSPGVPQYLATLILNKCAIPDSGGLLIANALAGEGAGFGSRLGELRRALGISVITGLSSLAGVSGFSGSFVAHAQCACVCVVCVPAPG
jgi:hypothetical protein